MTGIWLGMINAVKNILLKVLSEEFFTWLFFWSAKCLVESTKTTKDDSFYSNVKRIYDESE